MQQAVKISLIAGVSFILGLNTIRFNPSVIENRKDAMKELDDFRKIMDKNNENDKERETQFKSTVHYYEKAKNFSLLNRFYNYFRH